MKTRLCPGCDLQFTPVRQGKFCSTKCRDKINNKDKRARRKEAGLCQRCNEPSEGFTNCKPCRDWYRDYGKFRHRPAHLKRCYGLTVDAFNQLLLQQGGKCKMCSRIVQGNMHVDHCHTTGRIRGLLCLTCNMGLGWHEKYQTQYQAYLEESTKECCDLP